MKIIEKRSRGYYLTSSLIIVIGIILDQLTKWLAVRFLEPIDTCPLLEGVLHLTYAENRGAAFGMLANNRWIFLIVSSVAILAMIGYLFSGLNEGKLAGISLAMLISGGIGNMIDRVLLGYVIDFIDFCAFPNLWKWVFNIADSCVCVGTFMLSVWLIIDTVKAYKKEKAEKEAKEQEE